MVIDIVVGIVFFHPVAGDDLTAKKPAAWGLVRPNGGVRHSYITCRER